MDSNFDIYELFENESVEIIPITKFQFENDEIHNKLNHGYTDVNPIFPNWEGFFNRSSKDNQEYPNYMAYLLVCKKMHKIIGVLAVQLNTYEGLKTKVFAIPSDIEDYLYLSWIAVDKDYQKYNYFSILFEFYKTLIKKLRIKFHKRIEGTAIIIRRMRPIIWRYINTNIKCPSIINNKIEIKTQKYHFIFLPSECFDKKKEIKEDHLFMIFNSPQINDLFT